MKSVLHRTKLALLNTASLCLRKVNRFYLILTYPSLGRAFKIASHLTQIERVKLYQLSTHRVAVLEIGSYVGASACCFGAAMKALGRGTTYCVDTWSNDAMSEGSRDTWEEFQMNTKSYQQYIIPIRGFSADVVEDIANRTASLDLLFIDGDHSYEGVKTDWDTYNKFLKSGSIVVFHDWGWAEGVKRVIEEDVKPIVSSFNSLPNMWWGEIR